MYRFRSAKQILWEHEELDKQTIYFATPEELNDPTESVKETIWQHNRADVWGLAIEQFIACVENIEQLQAYSGMSNSQSELHPNSRSQKLDLDALAQRLSKANRHFTRNEMRLILFLCFKSSASLGDTGAVDSVDPLQDYLDTMDCLEAKGERAVIRELVLDFNRKVSSFNLNSKKNISKERGPDKIEQYSDLPDWFLNWCEAFIWPKYYVACFSRNYCDPTMWSHYADGHKGVCLIFDTVVKDGKTFLGNHGKGPFSTLNFREVSYTDRPIFIDVLKALEALKSHRGDRLISPGAQTWPLDYIEVFRKVIVSKSADWRREEESRLIWEFPQEGRGSPGGGISKCERVVSYGSNALKGIIFGVHASSRNKLEVLKVVGRIRKRKSQQEIKIYQAYIENGHVDVFELDC